MIKNIIFDFGNVLAAFDPDDMLIQCTGISSQHLKDIIFQDWDHLDNGTITYSDYKKEVLKLASETEIPLVSQFFETWITSLPPIKEIHDWIIELKEKGYHLYILSNAPVIFEEHVSAYPITQQFDGMVFSASIQKVKPNLDIYEYFLQKYGLKAEECYFIDDKKINIEGAIKCGIQGMVYQNNLEDIKKKVYR